jgi:hypothetical protein
MDCVEDETRMEPARSWLVGAEKLPSQNPLNKVKQSLVRQPMLARLVMLLAMHRRPSPLL